MPKRQGEALEVAQEGLNFLRGQLVGLTSERDEANEVGPGESRDERGGSGLTGLVAIEHQHNFPKAIK